MGMVNVSGTILAAPPGSGAGQFPASQFQDNLSLGVAGQGKPYQASASSTVRAINSPLSFVAIPGIGADGDVARVDTLYWKCDAPVVLELTQDDGTGSGTTVVEVPVNGLVVLEFPSQNALQGLRVKGSARCTFFAGGPS